MNKNSLPPLFQRNMNQVRLLSIILLHLGLVTGGAAFSHGSPMIQQRQAQSLPLWKRAPCLVVVLRSTNNNEDNNDEPKLVLDNMEDAIASLKTKYPTSEAGYLEAARKRAEEQRASVETTAASDEEWKNMARAKAQAMGTSSDEDGWESSKDDAASLGESQVLIPINPSSDDDSEEDEPKLLLF